MRDANDVRHCDCRHTKTGGNLHHLYSAEWPSVQRLMSHSTCITTMKLYSAVISIWLVYFVQNRSCDCLLSCKGTECHLWVSQTTEYTKWTDVYSSGLRYAFLTKLALCFLHKNILCHCYLDQKHFFGRPFVKRLDGSRWNLACR